jgi:lipopolysaccharide/colanic/teichoic acid biosynthesis glycosyltransferase
MADSSYPQSRFYVQTDRGSIVTRFLVKRLLDIAVSLSALIVFFPLFVLIGILIKCDSPGTVLYVSTRLGKGGRFFRCIKFRTMVTDADRARADLMKMNKRDRILFKMERDPRVTRLGRFLRKYSLDELPQFINVLCGEMSVVGPRPPLAPEVHQYEPHHLRRLAVIPGITGLWQVRARTDPSFDTYVSCDLEYIETWSVWLDLKIMFRTIAVVLAGTGS